jgi:glutamate-1-semialdehyde 2,1-aminomutase
LRDGLDQQAHAFGFTLKQSGPVQMPQMLFGEDPDFRLGYAWVSECLQRGVYLHPYHNMFLSAAHSAADVQETLKVTEQAFDRLKRTRTSLKRPPQIERFMARHSDTAA